MKSSREKVKNQITIPKLNFQNINGNGLPNNQIENEKIISCKTAREQMPEGLSQTFRIKKDNIKTNNFDKGKKDEYIFDLENTLFLNIDIVGKIIESQPCFSKKSQSILLNKIEKITEKIKQKKSLQEKKLKQSSKVLMTKQIFYEMKRTHLENQEFYQEQILEFTDNVEKKFSLIKQLEKKFEEVEIFVKRECKDPMYKNKFMHFSEFRMNYFMNENEFLLRQKSLFLSEMENYKKDLAEIIKENIEVKNTHNRNKILKLDSNKKKEIHFTKENKIIEKYQNKIKYLERNNQHLKAVYKDLSNKIVNSLNSNYGSNYFRSPAFFSYCATPGKSRKNTASVEKSIKQGNGLEENRNKDRGNNEKNIGDDLLSNINKQKELSPRQKQSSFKFDIQLYDKNILLNTIKVSPNKNKNGAKSRKLSNYNINSGNKNKNNVVNINSNSAKSRAFENLINNVKIEKSAKKKDEKNYIKIDENQENNELENNALVTSFDLNENEDNLGYHRNNYAPNSVSNSNLTHNANEKKPNSLKVSFKQKVNQLKNTNSNDNKNTAVSAKSKLEKSNSDGKNYYENYNNENNENFNYFNDEENTNNTINCMETGFEMLPKPITFQANYRKVSVDESDLNGKNESPRKRNSKNLFEKERRSSSNNNVYDAEAENENFNRNIELDIDFSIKHKSSIFNKNKENICDGPERNFYNFNNILANKSPSPMIKRIEREKRSEAKNKVIPIINLKSASANKVEKKEFLNEIKNKEKTKINIIRNNNDNSTTKNSDNIVRDESQKKEKNGFLNLGKSIISVLSQKSQEKIKLGESNNENFEILNKEKETKIKSFDSEAIDNLNANGNLSLKPNANFNSELNEGKNFDSDNRITTNDLQAENHTFNNVLDSNLNSNNNYNNTSNNFNNNNNMLIGQELDDVIAASDLYTITKDAEYVFESVKTCNSAIANDNSENDFKEENKESTNFNKINKNGKQKFNEFKNNFKPAAYLGLNDKDDVLNKINLDYFNNNNFDSKNFVLTEKTVENNSDNECKNSPCSSQSRRDSSPFSTLKTKTPKRLSDTLENENIWDISCIICQSES